MVSRAPASATKMKKCEGEQVSVTLSSKISLIKRQIQASRLTSINLKLRKNETNVESSTSHLLELAMSKMVISISEQSGSRNMLSYRIESPPCKLSGSAHGSGEKDNVNCQEVLPSTTIKLPFIEKIPPYTSWIFLDKNQRMAEDQSVVGRRQIYYDQYGGETLICSDSEEEIAEPVEEKHEFSEGEDQLLWKASQDNGLTQDILDILVQFIEATSSEIQDRYNILMEKQQESNAGKTEESAAKVSEKSILLEKSLSAALDSFDNLFCRRCLVFDCRLHGCSQSLVTPSEKQSYMGEAEENKKPCGDQCYLWSRKSISHVTEGSDTSASNGIEAAKDNYGTGIMPEERCSFGRTTDVSSDVNVIPEVSVEGVNNDEFILPEESNGEKRKVNTENESIPASNDFQGSVSKKQKKISTLDVGYVPSEVEVDSGLFPRASNGDSDAASPDDNEQEDKNVTNEIFEYGCKRHVFPGGVANDEDGDNILELDTNNPTEVPGMKKIPNSREGKLKGDLSGCEWKPIEKELYLKGVEIFGKNSCLIARNLLSGLKTCKEVSAYMFEDEAMPQRSALLSNLCLEDNGKADIDYMEQETTRSRIFRRRGRARKLKYTWKSAGHPSIRKRIADGKHQSCKQYTPCGCQVMCGKQCSCLHNGTCCEKYCGCSKSCKNRFRGCHCAKSQCRSRQCPCFAAGRECDPDVCRNCWVSCGDGSLGEPPARGDDYQCGNMRLLLRQQQRILLAKSDVAGWGAFIKNPVNKNDYLGEYTGELISHREADKRGKIYDRANSSFLFDLNDQYVLDAYRKGDKLKFANHSSNPNCYAKVMLVAGDHRVGIFAKEHIEASEELFYDYRYGPDQAPVWARKPEGSKRDDSLVSHGRAQKHQSH